MFGKKKYLLLGLLCQYPCLKLLWEYAVEHSHDYDYLFGG